MTSPATPSPQLIHIARQGSVIGKFPWTDIQGLLASGQVLRTDNYWIKGMPGWLVIGSTFDSPSASTSSSRPVPAATTPPIPVRTPPSLPPVLPARPVAGGLPKAFYLTPMFFVGAFVALVILVQGYAYVTLKAPLAEALASDSRNRGIEASAYYRYNIPGGSIVLNIDDIGYGTKNVDIMRVMLQFAKTQKHTQHDWVILSCRGVEKFKIKGAHFRTLGLEYGDQNPLYTMRTLPENIYRMNGIRAYPVWEGGALGVMSEQMKNFSEFTTEWLR